MAASDRGCCVPICGKTRDGDLILHSFPNPDKDMNRYLAWAQGVGSSISSLDPHYVYKHRKVCHSHFEIKYLTWSRRLSADAVPTLSLHGINHQDKKIKQEAVSSVFPLSKLKKTKHTKTKLKNESGSNSKTYPKSCHRNSELNLDNIKKSDKACDYMIEVEIMDPLLIETKPTMI